RRAVFLAMSFIGGSFRVKHLDLSIGAGGTATFKFQQRAGRSPRVVVRAGFDAALLRQVVRALGDGQ
ncbi:MAG: hypothetical protein M3O36_05635, partial [Myxococcota bacterium]|nr:hypothetical protein [Myxococcota bacterium]